MQIEENLSLAARRGKRRTLRIGITKAEREQYREPVSYTHLHRSKPDNTISSLPRQQSPHPAQAKQNCASRSRSGMASVRRCV